MKHKNVNRSRSKLGVLAAVVLIMLLGVGAARAEEGTPPPSDSNFPGEQHPSDDEGWELAAPVGEDLPYLAPIEGKQGFLTPSTTVVINELNEWSDKIELYNTSGSPVDMSGWVIKNYKYQDYFYTSYTFPDGFILDPGAYVVLHEGGKAVNNTSTDLYTGCNFYIIVNGGALALLDDTGFGVDFVRWGINITAAPNPVGWVGINPTILDNGSSLGRDASSTDTDYADDWHVQVSTFGAQNENCFPLNLYFIGSGTAPTAVPAQSSGCSAGNYVQGEAVTITAHPTSGWELGQWDESPKHEYLGTAPTLDLTMAWDRAYLYASYIQSAPDPGTVLLIGLWDPYDTTLTSLGIPFDQISGYTFAPDWDVLNRYDMLIYQAEHDPGYFVQNQRVTNYSTYLDEGNCMWVGTHKYGYSDSKYPNILPSHFGVDGWISWETTTTIAGRGTLFSGYGTLPYSSTGGIKSIKMNADAEAAFKGDDKEVFGVSMFPDEFISTFITYDFAFLQPADQEALIGRMADLCLTPPNDDFDNAIVIPSLNYRNVQAGLQIRQSTIAGDDPLMLTTEQKPYSVWYSYTPTETLDMSISTFGSEFNTVLSVWTGTRGSLALVVENDDFGTNKSKVEFTAALGTTYYIEVASSWFVSHGKLVLNVLSGFLFEDDFETGDLSLWTSVNDGGGFLSACGAGAINGSFGACVSSGTNDKRKQLTDDTPASETAFSSRINFDINGLNMADGERFRFLQTKMGAARPFFIVLKKSGSQYEIQLNTLLDDLTKVKTGWYVLSNAPHTIEVDWQASSSAGANDGYIELYMDGGLLESLTGLNNDTIVLDSFKLGFTGKLTGKVISGTFYLDDVATANGGYIGLP